MNSPGYLASKGRVAFHYGEATGRWAYNGRVSYWALGPVAPGSERYTWADYATDNGLEGHWWEIVGWDAP